MGMRKPKVPPRLDLPKRKNQPPPRHHVFGASRRLWIPWSPWPFDTSLRHGVSSSAAPHGTRCWAAPRSCRRPCRNPQLKADDQQPPATSGKQVTYRPGCATKFSRQKGSLTLGQVKHLPGRKAFRTQHGKKRRLKRCGWLCMVV